MIINRTPFRISFFGGGTDYPLYYQENGGAVLSTTIDKYCYISCRYLPPFFEHKHRIVYSKSEEVKTIDEINHPAVREVFRFMKVSDGIEIHHDGDLPARSGLGSSSSFTVGLLQALYALNGQMVSKEQLANESIMIEQDMIKENVGSQDQVAAAYGGFNKISFKMDSIDVQPMILSVERFKDFQDHFMLFYTGLSRIASEIAGEQIKNIKNNKKDLSIMHEMVDESIAILKDENRDLAEFGRLLNESWKLKRGLTDKITTDLVDNLYKAALSAGAEGGKLLGAGGGGFLLIFARLDAQKQIKERLKNILHVPFKFETSGSQIVFYQPNISYVIK
ncbi:MAG: kinase [Nitrospirae bacterium]|nr:kinase [Nitrospirota bacterium]